MTVEWFEWYTTQLDKKKKWPTFRDRFLCPCCYMPTLSERAGFDICPICFWEDDGQDSDNADLVLGGPNHDYSLTEARSNFEKHCTMYRPSDLEHFKRETAAMSFKKAIYAAYKKAIETKSEKDWLFALNEEEIYHDQGC